MKQPSLNSYGRLIMITAAAVLATYLLTRHQSHMLQLLPYLVLIACPLMHLFMHGGHGGHKADDRRGTGPADDGSRSPAHHH